MNANRPPGTEPPGTEPPGIGPHDRRAAIIDRAANTLRSILCPADLEVVVDHRSAELCSPSISCAIRLDGLLRQMVVPLDDHRNQWDLRPEETRLIDDFIQRAVDAAGETRTARLQDWSAVKARLMVRLIPVLQAGAVATPIGHGLALDVAIDFPGAVAIATEPQVAAWRMPAAEVLATAISNTRRELWTNLHAVEVRPEETESGERLEIAQLTVLSGSPWTSGAITALDRLMPTSSPARYVSLFDSETLAVFEPQKGEAADAIGEPERRQRFESNVAAMAAAWFEQHGNDHRHLGFNLFQIGRWPAIRTVHRGHPAQTRRHHRVVVDPR